MSSNYFIDLQDSSTSEVNNRTIIFLVFVLVVLFAVFSFISFFAQDRSHEVKLSNCVNELEVIDASFVMLESDGLFSPLSCKVR